MSSRHRRNAARATIGLLLAICGFVTNARAQDELQAQQSSAPETIDILAPPPPPPDPQYRACQDRRDAAVISGEIVVCREKVEPAPYNYSSRGEAEDRYAAATAFRDDPATPNPCGPNCGIFTGPPTISNLCIPGLQKCPPPPALFIDVSALPKAPPGSDADRIARGLPPIGNEGDQAARPALTAAQKQELGLPDPAEVKAGPTAAAQKRAVSPAGSAAPAEQQ